jgi:hypothetical protein
VASLLLRTTTESASSQTTSAWTGQRLRMPPLLHVHAFLDAGFLCAVDPTARALACVSTFQHCHFACCLPSVPAVFSAPGMRKYQMCSATLPQPALTPVSSTGEQEAGSTRADIRMDASALQALLPLEAATQQTSSMPQDIPEPSLQTTTPGLTQEARLNPNASPTNQQLTSS